jgi:hypothetical protein
MFLIILVLRFFNLGFQFFFGIHFLYTLVFYLNIFSSTFIMSSWTDFVTKHYREQKQKNPSYQFKDALKDAAKSYKSQKGGNPSELSEEPIKMSAGSAELKQQSAGSADPTKPTLTHGGNNKSMYGGRKKKRKTTSKKRRRSSKSKK